MTGAILRRPPGRSDPQAAVWTKRAIADFVETSFGIRLPEWILGAYLRDWGIPSQREVRRAQADLSAPPRAVRSGSQPAPRVAGAFRPEPVTGA